MARRKPKPVARATAGGSRFSCGTIAAIAVGGFLLLLAAFFIFGSRTKDMEGRVEDVRWTRSIVIEALGPVKYEDWRDDIPSGAVVRGCSPRVHHTQDQPASDAQKVCGTPYTVDTGTGFGEVVQDCQYEVHEDWCTYTVQEWRAADKLVLEGEDFSPSWPLAQLQEGQRPGQRDETYQCIFNVDGRRLTYRARDAQDFARCEMGSRWNLKVNTFNNVVGIEPAE
jgi:hypothetical protein